MDHNVPEYTMSSGDEVSALKERLDTLDKKLYGLAHFMVRMIHCVTSAISTTMKEELEMKNIEDHLFWVEDDMVQLLSKKWEKANDFAIG